MSARILDGRALAKAVRAETEEKVSAFQAKWDIQPTLALVRAGDDPASVSYARMIQRTCEQRGLAFQAHTRPADASEDGVVDLVRGLSAEEGIHGIIVQKPMPEGINDALIIEALDPAKDVDGAHPLNAGRLAHTAGRGHFR